MLVEVYTKEKPVRVKRGYRDSYDNTHAHLVEIRGGQARIETGEILEFNTERDNE